MIIYDSVLQTHFGFSSLHSKSTIELLKHVILKLEETLEIIYSKAFT